MNSHFATCTRWWWDDDDIKWWRWWRIKSLQWSVRKKCGCEQRTSSSSSQQTPTNCAWTCLHDCPKITVHRQSVGCLCVRYDKKTKRKAIIEVGEIMQKYIILDVHDKGIIAIIILTCRAQLLLYTDFVQLTVYSWLSTADCVYNWLCVQLTHPLTDWLTGNRQPWSYCL